MTKIRLSASYNLFNGEELLIPSIRNSHQFCEHISIIFQSTSNTGNLADVSLFEAIKFAIDKNLCQDLIWYKPDLGQTARWNERRKREIGLALAKKNKCSHYMTLDADEFYFPEEVNRFKVYFSNNLNDHDIVTVPSYLHIKRPCFRSKSHDTTRAILWSKITKNLSNKGAETVPKELKNVAPTRRFADWQSQVFKIHEITDDTCTMYHMNLVRKNGLNSKLNNTSSHRQKLFIEKVRDAYDRWNFPETLDFPGKPPLQIQKVKDYFNLEKWI